MLKFSRCLIAAAMACGLFGVFTSFAASTAVERPEGLVDLTSPDASKVTTTSTDDWLVGPGTAFHDDGTYTDLSKRVLKSASTKCNIIYTFDTATTVNAYGIKMFENGWDNQTPGAWTFYGSNTFDPSTNTESDETWVQLDARSGELDWTKEGEYRYYEFENSTAYTSYKMDFTGTSGSSDYIQFSYMEYFYHKTVVPYLGDCALTKVKDGEYRVDGVMAKNGAAVKLVFSADGGEVVEKALGEQTEGVPFTTTITKADGLSDAYPYDVMIVASNDHGTVEKTLGSIGLWFPTSLNDFAKKFPVTVPETVTDTLAGFPLLVRLSAANVEGFDYADVMQNGADILAADATGNFLPCELQKYDPNGESLLWVRVPQMTAGTEITIYYGNPKSLIDIPSSKDVWSDYAGVWHLDETTAGTTAIKDSTANATDGTAHTKSLVSEGVLCGARGRTDATGTNGAMASMPKNAALDTLTPEFTVSGWVMPTTTSGSWAYVFSRKSSDSYKSWGWQFRADGSLGSIGIYASGTSDNDSQRNVFSQSVIKQNAWTKYNVVYTSTQVSLYLDGTLVGTQYIKPGAAVNGDLDFTIGGLNGNGYGTLKGYHDEVRLRRGSVSAEWAAAEYAQEMDVFGTYGAAEPVDATAPGFLTPSATVSAQGEVTVTITVVEGSGSVYVDVDGEKTKVGDIDTEGSFPQEFVAHPTIAADKGAMISAYGINANGTKVYKKAACGTMNAAVVVTNTRDAKEDGRVPGIFTFSRPDTATNQDLIVNLAWSGTAEAGVDYEDNLPATVTIPAGETAVTVAVTPIFNKAKAFDTTVICTVTEGPYIAGGTATLTIKNVELDDRFNTWVGGGSDDKASTPENWSLGVPVNGQAILFDGRFANPSNKNCDWDIATDTVASWTQNNGYDGTITLRTVYPGKTGMEVLTVTGAMTIESGTLTHPQSVVKGDPISDPAAAVADLIANETYRIRIAAGSVSVGVDGKIDAMGKGYYMNNSGSNTMPYPSHGGMFSGTGCKVYGDPKEPIHVGLPYKIASGNHYVGKGGGAIYITATGAVKVDGVISANSSDGSWAENARASGAAGSVYIHAASVSGAGSITADGSNSLEQNNKGVGGRVAIITETPVDRGTFAAISAKVNTLNNKPAQATNFGGAGTVFFKDSTMTNGKLVIAEKSDRNGMSMDVVNRYTFVGTDGDWTFDSVEFAKNSYLVVPSGSELHLPSGLDSISSTATGTASGGVLYEGGIFDIGSNANQIMSGNWILVGWSNLVLNANVTVSGNAAIGVPSMGVVGDNGSSLPLILTSSVTVNGDLTVASDGFLKAVSCGCRKSNQWVSQGVLGHAAHGGRIMAAMNQSITCKSAYDSVFSPCLPGCGIPWPNGQGVGNSGGVMKLVVTGDFTLNGVANASGSPESHHQGGNAGGGSGGAIDITTGTIAGSGSITADGGSYSWMSGPGGRIAVKLTKPGADFSGFTGLIRATGRSRGSHGGAQGSAGTVYLKTGDEADFAGTLRIACPKYDSNDNWNNKTSTTELVSLGYGGDDVADYKKVKVEVRDYGFAAVNADVTVKSVTLATADAKLDLEGNTLTVDKFEYFANGAINNLAAGEYSFAQLSAIEGLNIVDTSAGQSGKIIVKERVLRGLKLILR